MKRGGKVFYVLAGLVVLSFIMFLVLSLSGWFSENNNVSNVGMSPDNFLNKAITQDSEFPISTTLSITNFKINADVILNSDDSLVRVILVDKNNKEYLVYEAYPLISDNIVKITDACDETCVLENVVPSSLKIKIVNANIKINSVSSSLGGSLKLAGVKPNLAAMKIQKESAKISKMNKKIKSKDLTWIAGETSVSKLSYEEKKKLFAHPNGTPIAELPNLQGFEYYKGGIFEIKDTSSKVSGVQMSPSDSNLPTSWDWRNVSGENWMTSVKNQGDEGNCWAHADLGAIESSINLYYNQHLNLDLSEQALVSCMNTIYKTNQECNYASNQDLCTLKYTGAVDESCYPYTNIYDPWGMKNGVACNTLPPNDCTLCGGICSDYQNRQWKITDYETLITNPSYQNNQRLLTEDSLKKEIIQNGPVAATVMSWSHEMDIVGYNGKGDWKTIQTCNPDEFCSSNGCISRTCATVGQTISVCVNQQQPSYISGPPVVGSVYNYECEPVIGPPGFPVTSNYWHYTGSTQCSGNMICGDNQCKLVSSSSVLTSGHKECSNFNYDYLGTYSEYRPGDGDDLWIFKNSWGTNWGESGYARLSIPLNQMIIYTIKTPIISPSPIAVQCVDKDNDKYCNWGISDQPPIGTVCPVTCKKDTQGKYIKDCDDSNINLNYFDSNFNCVKSSVIDSAFCSSHPYYSSQASVVGQACCFNSRVVNSNAIAPGDEANGNRFLCVDGKIYDHIHGINDVWTTHKQMCNVVGNYYANSSSWNGGWKSGNGEGVVCGDGKVCSEGACVSTICNDGDGGYNPYKFGSARIPGDANSKKTDYCQDSSVLQDAVCSPIGDFQMTSYMPSTCAKGCDKINSVCNLNSCIDNDGYNIYLSSSIIYNGVSLMDKCYSTTRVLEYTCNADYGNEAKKNYVNCLKGCVNGACVK